MTEWINNIDAAWFMSVFEALIYFIVGLILAKMASRAVRQWSKNRFDTHQQLLMARVASYLILLVFVVMGLNAIGFNLGVLIGAAGVLSVAIGFASQTSASNIISGLFLVAERPFSVGDLIKVGETTGEVLSIDLLSVKLRTFDNLFVRIPNETLIKSEVTTLTRFPIRRIDLSIAVALKEDIKAVRKVLEKVAEANPLCLDEPKPKFVFLGFGDSSLNMQFSVWVKRESFIELKNSIHEEIKEAFDAESIEIPFPHRSLYTGSVTEPFPIRLVSDADSKPENKD
ncbi:MULTISPECIES: mechanosensitive ion channel family protein [Methylophaga]|jgi:small-conductance mechanosensitive channel|uniref:Small-conductance mechanosensitive channel n=1 Tax=Methylophaga marina TaxID=45495 RepID=A0ABP3DAN9_9GAMM|nr:MULTISPECIES: mechanosensitive ion channel family protein [Methylophaga]BDZ73558.1 mechanosensitive ion channel protein MscS [Methylophaga marina]|tara:strand:+ start:5916 stop:6770 length:855 start_codon:yes stop_codon:yes gene_type:complete